MTNEIWLPISGYEGLYEVSNFGRIRSLFRYKKVLHPSNTNGYATVELWKDKVRKRIGVHRLVALAFVSNPNGKPFVNHKDETRNNNNADNLEWVTHIENCRYGTAIQRRTEHTDYSKRRINNTNQIKACSKPILQYTKDGTFVRRWNSASECHRITGISITCIRRCANGERKTASGYVFREGE